RLIRRRNGGAGMTEFRAGVASLPLEPPLNLPMVGFVRQRYGALGYGELPLEVNTIVLERGDTRVVLCGVDIVGIDQPEIGPLIDRAAQASGAAPAGVLLNWSHTHLAPTGGRLHGAIFGNLDEDGATSVHSFARAIQDKIVSAAQLAAGRLEPARLVWGQATA